MSAEELEAFAGAPLSSVGFDYYVEHVNMEMRPLEALPFEIYSHAEGRSHVAKQLLERIQKDCTESSQRWEESSSMSQMPMMKGVVRSELTAFAEKSDALSAAIERQQELKHALTKIRSHDMVYSIIDAWRDR